MINRSGLVDIYRTYPFTTGENMFSESHRKFTTAHSLGDRTKGKNLEDQKSCPSGQERMNLEIGSREADGRSFTYLEIKQYTSR